MLPTCDSGVPMNKKIVMRTAAAWLAMVVLAATVASAKSKSSKGLQLYFVDV